MCLFVEKIKKPKVHKNGFCTAWKVITDDNKSPFFNVISQYRVHSYQIGENIDKFYNGIDVDYGFHLLLKKGDAKILSKDKCFSRPVKAIKVFYKPEDVIAYGKSNVTILNNLPHGVTVKKLTVKSLDEVK